VKGKKGFRGGRKRREGDRNERDRGGIGENTSHALIGRRNTSRVLGPPGVRFGGGKKKRYNAETEPGSEMGEYPGNEGRTVQGCRSVCK